jgi:integrase
VTHRAGATFGELCEMWLAHASGHLTPNTMTETRRIVERTLLPRPGHVPLAGLRPEHLDALYVDLLRGGRGNGKPTSPASVLRIHRVARRALTVGVRWGWINANPALVAMPPRAVRRAISPPSPAEVTRLLDAADPDLDFFILLAATTGARRGELCGLRRSDLDLTESQIEVARTVIVVDGHCELAATKTRQTRRIALDSVAVGTLHAHRLRAERRARRAGCCVPSDGFVFTHHGDGQCPWRPDSTSRAFRRLRQAWTTSDCTTYTTSSLAACSLVSTCGPFQADWATPWPRQLSTCTPRSPPMLTVMPQRSSAASSHVGAVPRC